MRIRTLAGAAVLAAAMAFPLAGSALAQGGPDCADFTTQEEAQAALDASPPVPTNLDDDGDGIACEDLPSAAIVAPPLLDEFDCADFMTQEEAQAILESNQDDPNRLDDDDDGIACEDLPTAVSDAGSGTVDDALPQDDLDCADFMTQDEAQAILESNQDDPNRLDDDDDGIACEDLPTAVSDAGDDQVAVVPEGGVDTGDGSTSGDGTGYLLVGLALTAAGATAYVTRRTARRAS